MRTMLAVSTAAMSVLAAATTRSTAPDPCTLLTAQEASTLVGSTLTAVPSNGGGVNCRYNGAGAPVGPGVEITVRSYADGPTAHAAFPRWVVPVPPLPADMTATPVTGVGDEATITRTPPAVGISGIFFRRAATLVKIGVHPAATDAALKTAGAIVAGRF